MLHPKPDEPIVKYSRPGELRFGSQDNLPDPFERRHVYVGESSIKEDGVFAKRNIMQGDLLCYYSGLIHNLTENPKTFTNQTEDEQ